MRVLLANPPWRKEGRLGVRAGSRWAFTMPAGKGDTIPPYVPFPFFLAYAAAVLERAGLEVRLIDAIAEGKDPPSFLTAVEEYAPDLALLETSTPSIDSDLALGQAIKDCVPGVRLALSGPHVSALPIQTLETAPQVDFILVGEYEYTLRDLAICLKEGGDLGQVLGLVWREADRTVRLNPRRPLIANLDELPWPARHLLPMQNYCDSFAGLPMPGLPMWASRGCPFRCIFCVWPRVMYGGQTYRVRDPIDVVDEMEQTAQQYNMRSVSFDDDTFDIGKPRILTLCREITQRNLRLPWTAMARADTADREMLEAMAEAGLYAIKYGVESGVQELVDAADKSLDLSKVKETVRITKDLGVKVHLTFTLGLPGETEETIRRTIDFAAQVDPDSVQFSIATPYPGTVYYEMARQNGTLVARNWTDFDGADQAVVRTATMSPEELEAALIKARRQWRWRQFRRNFWKRKRFYLQQGLKNPGLALKFLQGRL
ncbi:MAG: B12-binding domain-containing radical SAM protein [Anaerolineae bacterium]